MRVYIVYVLFAFISINISNAKENNDEKADRVLIVLNGSVSMLQPWGNGNSRYDIASDIITTLIAEVYAGNTEVEFGLRVYGHQFRPEATRCADTRKEVLFSKDNLAQMALRLKDIVPRGNGSVEYALKEAINSDFIDTQLYRYSIIVITDSNKACADNICIPVNEFGKKGSVYKRYVVDLLGKEILAERYTCFDKVFPALNDYSIDTCINHIAKDFKKRNTKQIRVVYESKPKTTHNIEVTQEWPAKKIATPVTRSKTIADTNTTINKPVANDDTIRIKTVETVQIRKESRIKSEIDEFGYLKLLNTSIISRLIIYQLQKGNYVEINEIYPVGMNEIKVKLKTGAYKMVFNVGGITEGTRTFEIKNDIISEILFR